MDRIIKREKSVIIACDVPSIEVLQNLVKQTCFVEGIGGYKIGAILTITYGLEALVAAVRELTDLPIIYDHQKAMTDIPDIGKEFTQAVKRTGADALIGFPQSGPATERSWIHACFDVKLKAIIGGEMTHPNYLRSAHGYIADDALDEIYLLAAQLGINNFVVPGNMTKRISHYKEILQDTVKDGLTLFLPGLVTQGGKITDTARVAGEFWHAIVGRAIYESSDYTLAAKQMTKEIMDE